MEEDKNDSSLSYAKIDDDEDDDSINMLEKTAKKVANVIRESLGSGAKAAEKKVLEAQDLIDAKQVETEEQLAAKNISKIENSAKQPNIDDDEDDDSINMLEKTAKKVANVIRESLGSGAKAAEKKVLEAQDLIDAKQVETEEQLAAKNISKIENSAKQPNIDDDEDDDSINMLEKTAKKVANVIRESLGSGAKAAEKKVLEAQDLIDAKQVETEEQLAAKNISKIENSAKQPNIDDDEDDDSINMLEKTAKKVANVIRESLGSGAKAAEKKVLEAQDLIDAKQVETEEQLAAKNISKIENSAKQPNIDDDEDDDSINMLEKTAKKVANVIRKSLGSGAKAAEKKVLEAQDLIDAKQVETEEQLAAKNISKIENSEKQPNIDDDEDDDSINMLEKTAKKVANVIRKSLGSGAKAAEKKVLEAQDLIDAKQVETEE